MTESRTITWAKSTIGADAKYSKAFSEAKAIVEEAGRLTPLSLYFLINGKMPEPGESVEAMRDGGRCAILPEPLYLDGKKVFLGIKGTGYNADASSLKPTDAAVKNALNDYLSIKANSKDPSLDLFITSTKGTMIGSDRPMGGQSRKMAEWSLDFSNRLSRTFRYKGTYFTPTIAVVGHDSKAKEVIGKLNKGEGTFKLDDIVEEYRLLPSTLKLNEFLCLPSEEMQPIMQKAGPAKFRRNFLSSLYHLAAFTMNTLDKETFQYLDLLAPYGGNLITETMIGPDGKVYWKDLDNLSIASSIDRSNGLTKETLLSMAKGNTSEHIATALDCSLNLNRRTSPKFGDDLSEAKAALDDFVGAMGKAKGTQFTGYKMSEKITCNSEYWKTFNIELSYHNKTLGNGTLELHFAMPVHGQQCLSSFR